MHVCNIVHGADKNVSTSRYLTKVHVFIDDSGDPGFKLDKGSTTYFVIACAIFKTDEAAEKTSLLIEKYKRELNFGINEEFRFSKSSKRVRRGFFKHVANQDYIVRAIVINKHFIYSSFLRENTKSLYNFAIKEVLTKSSYLLDEARVKIDGQSGRKAKQAFFNYIRTQVNNHEGGKIKSVKLRDSKSDNLIQLADMLAGAIRKSFDGEDANSYKVMLYEITSREGSDIWQFK